MAAEASLLRAVVDALSRAKKWGPVIRLFSASMFRILDILGVLESLNNISFGMCGSFCAVLTFQHHHTTPYKRERRVSQYDI